MDMTGRIAPGQRGPGRPDHRRHHPGRIGRKPTGEQLRDMESDKLSRGDRFRKKVYERADDIQDVTEKNASTLQGIFGAHRPAGQDVTYTAQPAIDRPVTAGGRRRRASRPLGSHSAWWPTGSSTGSGICSGDRKDKRSCRLPITRPRRCARCWQPTSTSTPGCARSWTGRPTGKDTAR